MTEDERLDKDGEQYLDTWKNTHKEKSKSQGETGREKDACAVILMSVWGRLLSGCEGCSHIVH